MELNMRIFLTLLSIFSLCLALIFASCKEENIKKLMSPVQAVTTLLQKADGSVEADLALISTETDPHEFVTSATNVELRVPGGKQVPLDQEADGHYKANSAGNSDLLYVGGETYQFRFELTKQAEDQEVEQGDFVAVVTAPDNDVSFTWADEPEFTGDTAQLTWTPKTFNAIVNVYGPDGSLTYSTFDFSEPQFEGDKWARLGTGGALTIPVMAFPDAGSYRVTMCAVVKTSGFDEEISDELGVMSGFLAGKCAEDRQFELSE
jgi:hypothetical protein